MTEQGWTYAVRSLQAMQLLSQRIISRWSNRRSVQSFVSLFLIGAVLSTAIAACSGNSFAKQPDVKLRLVSFSVTKAAHDQIIPKFREKWLKEHQQNVTFEQSYGGSGAQTADIIAGRQEADIAHLALPLDVIKIQQAGLIEPDWENREPRNGIVSRSVAAIVTREGNPKNIKTWADLAKSDVKVVLANPKTSGVAIWQFLAFWGSITQTGGENATAQNFVTQIYKNTPSLAKDAREASDLFFQKNQGDALVNYENEVIFAELNRPKLPYVVPKVNISIDNPVTVVDKYVDKHGTREVAEAFIEFLYSTEAQREFAKLGFRPVNPIISQDVALQYPTIDTVFTSQDLGGWDDIQKEFFADGAIFDKIEAKSKT
jgi:sulfate/thiosulfate transport system substrate-binding protein